MDRKTQAPGILCFALAMGMARAGSGQGLVPPTPGADLDQLSRRMAEGVRDLGEDIASGIGQAPGGQDLVRDVQELQRATGDWYASARSTNDPYQLRRSYSGIDISWHRLRGRLVAPGFAPQPVIEEVRRVERADNAIHQALNLNEYPPNFDGAKAAPTGVDEARRLAYSLAQRGEALASTVQGLYGGSNLVDDSAEIARMVDVYYDTLNNPQGPPPIDAARQAFVPIVQKSTSFGIAIGQTPMPPPLNSAWANYTAALNLLRSNLGLANAPIDFAPSPTGPVGAPVAAFPAAQVVEWAEGLDRQVDELIANFAPTAIVVPEGREMLGDMERLRKDVRDFRGDAARGLDPGRLAFEFREVDADWQRLARRVNRIARGRTGPNIQRVQQIGQSCEQIHRVLGMPGYPPVIQPY